jgi:hypothetical protein
MARVGPQRHGKQNKKNFNKTTKTNVDLLLLSSAFV